MSAGHGLPQRHGRDRQMMVAPVAFCDRLKKDLIEGVTLPTIRNVHVKNVSASGAPAKQAIVVVGLPELPIDDVTFENVEIVAEKRRAHG